MSGGKADVITYSFLDTMVGEKSIGLITFVVLGEREKESVGYKHRTAGVVCSFGTLGT